MRDTLNTETAAGDGPPATTSQPAGRFSSTTKLEWCLLATVLAPEVALKHYGPAVSAAGPLMSFFDSGGA
jgi:hypothetical protein